MLGRAIIMALPPSPPSLPSSRSCAGTFCAVPSAPKKRLIIGEMGVCPAKGGSAAPLALPACCLFPAAGKDDSSSAMNPVLIVEMAGPPPPAACCHIVTAGTEDSLR